jgi:tetratricopeptide (TPR) repeat protein
VLAGSADLDAGIADIEAARDVFAVAVDQAPEEYERATFALGRAYMQQIRFDEAVAVTGQGIDVLRSASPPHPDHFLARLGALNAWTRAAAGRPQGVLEDADAAMAAGRLRGDLDWELDVMEHWASARDEVGEASIEHWALLEQRARAAGRTDLIVLGGRISAVFLADTDPGASLEAVGRIREIAAAHGLAEAGGWTDLATVESLWVVGRWDEALEVGASVVALAERNAYERLAFRVFVNLLAIAAARRLPEVADHWDRWWSGAEAHFPRSHSLYGAMLHGTIPTWLAQARRQSAEPPKEALVDAVVPVFNPHFLNAIDTTVRAWLDAGRTDLAAMALERATRNAEDPDTTRLARASVDLLEAWVTGNTEPAERVIEMARAHPAPWWELRALRAIGDPSAEEVARRLGIPPV